MNERCFESTIGASENAVIFQVGVILAGHHQKAHGNRVRGHRTHTCTTRQSFLFRQSSHSFLLAPNFRKDAEIAKQKKNLISTGGSWKPVRTPRSPKCSHWSQPQLFCLLNLATLHAFVSSTERKLRNLQYSDGPLNPFLLLLMPFHGRQVSIAFSAVLQGSLGSR